ncbi:class I SAM-dependent methyltransferase [Arsenicibacter rosenii]|uniref:Methyltransferase domain-containing protein n=1 Tax=Arsenicibacter rosenii TaxID=1750698 RepID=A0A1S2VCE1_9BACT|nr:class I SAM-dependent methyltransferase [Arsenicibacter rosenii]OIN55896.1 hypothetical protein BLX24_27485 [Arsenicibacter rosenii]
MENHRTTLYTTLAAVYDAMYRTFIDYDEEFIFYNGLLQQHHCRSVLEIGCGSGHLASRLSPHVAYTGMDISADMLALARQHAPDVRFMEADMTDFTVAEPFDAVLITARSISYVLTNAQVLSAFRHIAGALNPEGILIFDFIEATSFFDRLQPDQVLVHDASFGTADYRRESRYVPNLATGLTWNWHSAYFARQRGDGSFAEIGRDLATLRAFLPFEVKLLLKEAGFSVVETIVKSSYAFDTHVIIANV